MESAFLIAGTKSGAGKTLVTLSIMACLRKHGKCVQSFKCGPDFIDPSLHQLVTGRISSNLDFKMCSERFCHHIYQKRTRDCDVAVVEGVMGLFDGAEGSGAYLAEKLSLPIVLIVDVRSAAQSVAAVVHGFETYNRNLHFGGVIFNFCGSKRHEQLIREEVEQNCKTPVIGFLRRTDDLTLSHRHLGLHMGQEAKSELDLDAIAHVIEQHLDIETLLENTRVTVPVKERKKLVPARMKKTRNVDEVVLAVAEDDAFCFYYKDNLDLFESVSIVLKYFSPVRDRQLPDNIHGVFLGGGYPELFASQLSTNRSMLDSIKLFSDAGGLVYGECGGFMYLTEGIYDQDKNFFKMCGVFPVKVAMGSRLRRLGYRKPVINVDCFLGKKGDVLSGHEFHYSDLEEMEGNVENAFTVDNKGTGFVHNNTIASYIHLHFGDKREIAQRVYEELLKIKQKGLWSNLER